MIARMVTEKQVEQGKVAMKQQVKPATESVSTPASSTGGSGINFHLNMMDGSFSKFLQRSFGPQRDRADSELENSCELPLQGRSMPPAPPPSSPIPSAKDEDSRLIAFIESRSKARSKQAGEFQRVLSLLTRVNLRFSNLATLSYDEWKEMDISVDI
jgi:hypothetical protein